MKKFTIIFLTLFCIVSINNAQINMDWAINSLSNTSGGSVAIDTIGNIFILGYSSNTITLKKYNSTGALINTLIINTAASSEENIKIEIDVNNNLIMTGIFDGITDFYPGIGTYNLTGNQSIFLAKYSNDLNSLICAYKLIDGYHPTALRVSGSSNIYLCYVPNSGVQNKAYLSKINVSNGNFLWSFSLDVPTTSDITIKGIDVNNLGEVYISGSIYNVSSYPDFDPSANTFTNIGGPVFFAKYDTLSNFIWAKGISTSSMQPNTYIKYFNGNVFIASKGNGDIDPNPSVENMNGTFFVAQYNSLNGDIVWGREIKIINPGFNNDQQIMDLEVNQSGYIFVSGDFETGDSIDFDVNSSAGIFPGTGTYDGFVTIYDFNNNFIDGFVLQTTQNSYANSVAIKDDILYVGGHYYGITDFDPIGTYNLTASGSPEMFLAKYTFVTTGIGQLSDILERYSIYPNPANATINIAGLQAGQVEIMNLQGQVIKNISLTGEKTTIDISKLSSGVYMMRIKTKDGIVTKKLIKE